MTLEKLSAAKNLPEVHIYADSVPESSLREMEIVRDQYLPEAFLFHAKPHRAAASGSWNILHALKDAAKYADEVYLVEDDVMVYPDFFQWHATQTSDISCGRKLPNYEWYTNPGSRFSRRALDAIIPHINADYYRSPGSYCERNFRTQFISYLDDGLIRRVVADEGLTVSFPDAPKCAHQGIPMMGKLDIYQVEGETLTERIKSVRKIVAAPKNPERYAPVWEPYRP